MTPSPHQPGRDGVNGLYEAKTRVSRSAYDNLVELARRNDRSMAAEIRLAILAHLADNGYRAERAS